MIAGLEDITSGTLSIGGRVVNDLAPRDRDVALVFQSYALYPHLTVEENIGFGLRVRGAAQGGDRPQGARDREAARTRALSRPQAEPAFRRPAAARRDGPRARARVRRPS